MFRMILCIAGGVLVATGVQSASANDRSVCASPTPAAACTHAGTPGAAVDDDRGYGDHAPPMRLAAGAGASTAGPSADLETCRSVDNKDLTQRLEACTRAIAASSGNPDVVLSLHRKRMALYAQLGQLDRMVPDCDEVIRLAPDDRESAFAYGLRGLQLVRQHELGRAMTDLDKAITLDPSQFSFYFTRAQADLETANFRQARADIDKMLSLNPEFALGYWLRAQYHFELDDDAGALADTTEGLRRDPQNADCAALRAEYELRADKLTEAQADAERAVAAGPRDAAGYAVRGRVALAQGRTDAAVSDLTKAIDLDNDAQPGPLAYRGTAHERTGNTELATADYRHALESAPYSRMDREALAVARQRLAALTQPQQPAPAAAGVPPVQPVQPAPSVQAAHPSTAARKCRNGLEVDCIFRSIGVLGQRACSQLFGSCPGPRH